MRYHLQGRARDQKGRVLGNIGITIYLSGTTTPVTIYTTYTTTSSVISTPQLTTDATGFFSFFVDSDDYVLSTLFDIVMNSITYTYVDIFKARPSISNPSLLTNLTYSGTNIATFDVGENVVFGDVCYLKSDGKMWKADSNNEVTTKGLISIATNTITTSGVFLLSGFIRKDAWSFTVSGTLYISTAPGNPTQTSPISGEFSRKVGYANKTNIIHFNPSDEYQEIA